LKFNYAITYGKMIPGWSFEKIEQEMAKYKTDVEKGGIKIAFWGHPYGVSEDLVIVFEIGGDMDKYLKAVMGATSPMTDSRTDFVMVH